MFLLSADHFLKNTSPITSKATASAIRPRKINFEAISDDILQIQQHCRDPGENDRRVALDDLIVTLCREFIPGDFFLTARAGVRTVRHWRGADFDESCPIANFIMKSQIMFQ